MKQPQTIFVTGGASGIGLAIVAALVAADWRAIAADVNPASLHDLQEKFPTSIECVHLDVSSEDEVIRTIAQCEQQYGPITGVVNSAGVGTDVPGLQTDAKQFQHILAVNLIGSFLVAREAANRMRLHGGGAIVNLVSVSGIRGNAGRTAYGASKGGVITMTKIMAVEWAEYGIRVNAIGPGPVDTPLARQVHTGLVKERWRQAVPLKRYGTPAEIASAALFLLDERQSGFITGQTLCVDGGFTAAGLLPEGAPLYSTDVA